MTRACVCFQSWSNQIYINCDRNEYTYITGACYIDIFHAIYRGLDRWCSKRVERLYVGKVVIFVRSRSRVKRTTAADADAVSGAEQRATARRRFTFCVVEARRTRAARQVGQHGRWSVLWVFNESINKLKPFLSVYLYDGLLFKSISLLRLLLRVSVLFRVGVGDHF